MTGCPLRCGYCDTEYAFHEGRQIQLAAILAELSNARARRVCVTGGEPLAQPGCLVLLKMLCDQGLKVSLETSGAMDIAGVDERVKVIMDMKTPGSGECDRNLESNVSRLRTKDEVKFVICDRNDYEWSKAKVDQYDLLSRVGEVLFSPSFAQVKYEELEEWIIQDRIQVRMQVQLHKIIWGNKPGH